MENYLVNIDECFVYNWRKCQEGDLSYTRKDRNKGTEEEDIKAFELIQDSYYDVFGLGKQYLEVLELKKDIALAECELVITSDNFIKNEIKRLKRELNNILTQSEGGDLSETLVHVSKWMGSQVKEKETTVLELYKMLEVMRKEAERMKQKQPKV